LTFDEFICQIPTQTQFPQTFKQFDVKNKFNTKYDLCRFIIAHELCHATCGHPENFYNHRIDSKKYRKMENCCDAFAEEIAGTGVV